MKMVDIRKKYNLKEIRVYMGVFDYVVIVAVGDRKKVHEYVSFKFEDSEFTEVVTEFVRGKTYHRVGYCPIIWIPRIPKTPREYATLAHEALHATYHLFDWVGLEANHETEEVMAHSMAHIINSVLDLEEQKK